ncbi:MAG: enoyl-[acyl-carrier protein] reductase I [Planctomycetota bacterium]|jgi:enoyl-[acyl-carrier protein] reductase I
MQNGTDEGQGADNGQGAETGHGASDWLGLRGKTFVVMGLKNKKSVAWHVAKQLLAAGARCLFVVRTEERRDDVKKLTADAPVYICDVRDEASIQALGEAIHAEHGTVNGLVHSIAFANYSDGWKPFHETRKDDFLEATGVSAFSLVQVANALKASFADDASVVTISISSTTMAAENYGYMAPIKAALDSSVVFLAKSFSAFSHVRFNGVRAGLLKTSSSAGIPGYVDSWIHAEKATLRKAGLKTEEVASTTLFLLSARSSGINGQGIVVDAGMGSNFFDSELTGGS